MEGRGGGEGGEEKNGQERIGGREGRREKGEERRGGEVGRRRVVGRDGVGRGGQEKERGEEVKRERMKGEKRREEIEVNISLYFAPLAIHTVLLAPHCSSGITSYTNNKTIGL